MINNQIEELKLEITRLQERNKELERQLILSYTTPKPDRTKEEKRTITEFNKQRYLEKKLAKKLSKQKDKKQSKVKIEKEYSWEQRYEHPMWKKRSQQIKRRDNFTCTSCGNKNNLVVHHHVYQSGFKIWEYGGEHLTTWCHTCHEKFHAKIKGSELVNKGIPIVKYLLT